MVNLGVDLTLTELTLRGKVIRERYSRGAFLLETTSRSEGCATLSRSALPSKSSCFPRYSCPVLYVENTPLRTNRVSHESLPVSWDTAVGNCEVLLGHPVTRNASTSYMPHEHVEVYIAVPRYAHCTSSGLIIYFNIKTGHVTGTSSREIHCRGQT